MKTLEQKYIDWMKDGYKLCEEMGVNDPFSYAVSREICAAFMLGHKLADTYSGADAIDQDGECEYKSTIGKDIQGAYTGISVQPTWEEQERYLREEKIGKYTNHYFNRFEKGMVVECYTLKGSKVLEILLPKIKKKFPDIHTKKDPRLSATITKTEIYKYGRKINEFKYN